MCDLKHTTAYCFYDFSIVMYIIIVQSKNTFQKSWFEACIKDKIVMYIIMYTSVHSKG